MISLIEDIDQMIDRVSEAVPVSKYGLGDVAPVGAVDNFIPEKFVYNHGDLNESLLEAIERDSDEHKPLILYPVDSVEAVFGLFPEAEFIRLEPSDKLDSAFVGYSFRGDIPCLAYSYPKLLEHFMSNDGMDYEEAIKWISHNTAGGFYDPSNYFIIWGDNDG